MKKGLKITGIVLLALLMTACVALDIWWFTIYKFGKEEVVSKTTKVGLQVLENGNESHFCEINYMSNANKNGVEMFEIKFTQLLDENKDAFASQGLQFIARDSNSNISWVMKPNVNRQKEYDTHVDKGILGIKSAEYKYHYWYGFQKPSSTTQYYNYASLDDYNTTINSANPINSDSFFKILIDDEIYGMQFKYDTNTKDTDTLRDDVAFISREKDMDNIEVHFSYTTFHYNDYYVYEDYQYFCQQVYDAIKSLPSGTNQTVPMEFGDLFRYYDYNQDKNVYYDQPIINNAKVKQELKNYYSILVHVSDDGANKSTDSMFNTMYGTPNYNSTDTYVSDDYFTGRSVIDLDLNNFKLVSTNSDNVYLLDLSDASTSFYNDYKDKITFNIELDLSEYNKMGISFDGFVNNFKNKYSIYQIKLTEFVDGQTRTRTVATW